VNRDPSIRRFIPECHGSMRQHTSIRALSPACSCSAALRALLNASKIESARGQFPRPDFNAQRTPTSDQPLAAASRWHSPMICSCTNRR
jgi:hypothetical protein